MPKIRLSRRVLVIAGALGLALFAAAAWWSARSSVRGLVRQLATSDRTARAAAADRLAKITDDKDIRRLVHYLGDSNPAIRREVARVLVRIGALAAQPIAEAGARAFSDGAKLSMRPPFYRNFFPSYFDRFWRVQYGAYYVLAKTGKPAAPALVKLLSSTDLYYRLFAITALRAAYDPSIDATLVTALKDPRIGIQAAAILGEHGCSAAADALAATASTGKTGTVGDRGVAAAWALARLGDLRAVAPLVALLANGRPEERYNAVRSLGLLNDAKASQAVAGALADLNPQVRQCAAIMLWRAGSAGAVEALRKAADDPDESVRLAARAALAHIEGNPRGPAYDDVDSRPAYRVEEAPVAASPDELRQIRQAVRMLTSDAGRAKASAIFDYLKSREAIAALVETADDDDPAVRAWAASQLATRRDPAAVAALIKLADDPDLGVKVSVMQAPELPVPAEQALIAMYVNGTWAVPRSLQYIGGREAVVALEAHRSGNYGQELPSVLSQIDLRASKAALGMQSGAAKVESTAAQ